MLQVWLITQLRHNRTHGRCAAAAWWSSVCMTFQTSIFWIAGMSATHKNHLYHIPSPHIGLNLPPLWGIIKGKEANNHHNNDNLCTALEQVFTTIMLHFCTIFSISRSTEGTWAIQMSCCHTGPHHVLCVLFQHHCDLQIFLSPKPNISCMSTLINCWALQDIWSYLQCCHTQLWGFTVYQWHKVCTCRPRWHIRYGYSNFLATLSLPP